MDSEKIETYLKKRCGKIFSGVFSSDTLPTKINLPSLLVCNTDEKDLPGEHWIAIYVGADGKGEFFDSFGREPGQPFNDFMDKHCERWIFNNRQIQNITSAFCGHHCIFYCMYRSLGFDMNTIVSKFSNNTAINDHLVHVFVCGK